MYSNLRLYRVICINIEPICWTIISKYVRGLKYASVAMLKLLSGCNCLRQYNSDDHKCFLCNGGNNEDVEHFIMFCTAFSCERENMFQDICKTLDHDTQLVFCNLSKKIVFYICMGMDYPFHNEILFSIRKIACYHISKMYYRRLQLDIH